MSIELKLRNPFNQSSDLQRPQADQATLEYGKLALRPQRWMSMIELYGFYPSRSNRPQWVLEEIGAPYVFYEMDFRAYDHQTPEYLALNPSGKIPALRDGDFVLTESPVIATYLAQKFPEAKLLPEDPQLRLLHEQWMMFLMTELEQPLWTAGKHKFALPKEYRVPEVRPSAEFEFRRAAKVLADHLGEREFLLGDHLTVVDLLTAHTLGWASRFQFPAEHENLNAYRARLEARPSFGRMAEKERKPFPRAAQ